MACIRQDWKGGRMRGRDGESAIRQANRRYRTGGRRRPGSNRNAERTGQSRHYELLSPAHIFFPASWCKLMQLGASGSGRLTFRV